VTVHFGPENVVAELELFFRDDLSADGVGTAIDRIQRRLKGEQPMLKHVFIEAQSTAPMPMRSTSEPDARPFQSIPR
jgi:hypothetical protein